MGARRHALRLAARHPHPALRATFPRVAGEGMPGGASRDCRRHWLASAQADARADARGLLPAAVAGDLLPLPPAAAGLERAAVVPVLVAAETRQVGGRRPLRGDAALR